MSEPSRKVVFRADASLQIGSGHVMRCLTLADVLRRKGFTCHFICRGLPASLEEMIAGRGHQVHKLPAAADPVATNGTDHARSRGFDWEEDAGESSAALEKILPDWLVVDHYALDARWEQDVSRYCERLF